MTAPLSCVVDASVAVKLYLAEPLASEARALFDLLADRTNRFHVPDLFFAECANILWKQVQWQGALPAQVAAHLADLTALPLQRTPVFDLAADALAIAMTHGITAYDACYVALARRKQVALITADDKLIKRLTGTGESVLWLGNWQPPAAGD